MLTFLKVGFMLPPASFFAHYSLRLLLVAFININREYFSHTSTTRILIGVDLEVVILVDLQVPCFEPYNRILNLLKTYAVMMRRSKYRSNVGVTNKRPGCSHHMEIR